MGKVPVFQKQVDWKAPAARQVDMAGFSEGWQESQESMKQLHQITSEFARIDTLKKKTDASISLQKELNTIKLEAENSHDTDEVAIAGYRQKVNAAIAKHSKMVPGISSNAQANVEFTAIGESTFNAIRDSKRKQAINEQQYKSYKQIDIFKDAYLGASSQAERDLLKQQAYTLIDDNVKVGVWTPAQGNSMRTGVDHEWAKSVAKYDAATNPDLYRSMRNEYGLSKKELLDADDIAEKAEIKMAKEYELASAQEQMRNQKLFLDNEDKMDIGDKLRALEDGISTGDMSKSWAEKRKAAILSAEGVTAKTQTEYFYNIIKKINKASSDYSFLEDSVTAMEYIKVLAEAEEDIEEGIAKGFLTEADRKILYNRIHTKEASKSRADVPDDISRSISYFEKVLPTDMAREAIRQFISVSSQTKDKTSGSVDELLKSIHIDALKAKDPSFSADNVKDVTKVRQFNVGQRITNPSTGEIMVMGKDGKWVKLNSAR